MNISDEDSNQSSWTLIVVILTIVLAIFLFWKFGFSDDSNENLIEEPIVQILPEDVIIENDVLEDLAILDPIDEINDQEALDVVVTPEYTDVIELTENKPVVQLNESDSWVQEKLMSIIWRKELIDLFVDEDMIRRFVVFVDNFSQGNISYNNSPVVKPVGKLKVLNESNNNQPMIIDESSFKRFTKYVELLRAIDTDILVQQYSEFEPLLKEAYSELGYPDSDFKDKLQSAITKVLDVEFPKGKATIIRPSVMYKYEDQDIESLDDTDKLMIRMGKENLLIIKSVLLEINEKLEQ